jgi:signal transduction histidine kinase
MLAMIYIITQTVFLRSFLALEAESVQENVERVVNALSDELVSLSSTAADWAYWDATAAFMQGANENYVTDNLSPSTLLNLHLNFMIFMDTQGRIVFSKGVNLQTSEEIPVPDDLALELSRSSLLLDHSKETVTGILQTLDGALLIASRAILNNQLEGPSMGTLVMGRYLNDQKTQALSESLRMQIDFHPYSEDHSDTLATGLSSISVQALDEHIVTGYTALADIYGEPRLDLHIQMPRNIYAQGQATLQSFLFLFLGVGILFTGFTLVYIDRAVMSRLSMLSRMVSQIRETGDTHIDVSIRGNDEITNLANGLREMLDALAQSRDNLQQAHDNLESQVSQRTVELTEANKTLRHEIAEREQAQTELAQARDQALEALRLKTQILANISHDARTPLSVILLRAQMLQSGHYGPVNEKQRERLESIVVNVNQLTAFINHLLDGAQMEMAQQIKLNYVDIAPSKLLAYLHETAKPLADRKNLELHWCVSKDLPATVRMDSARFNQIVANLVGNAIKFTREGSISVQIDRPDPNHWMLEVSDTGPGIPEDALPHIFDTFWQVDGSMTRETNRGVGLGLSIVKQLTTAMGGQISVQSQVGVGTTFRIKFALEEQDKDRAEHERLDCVSC